MDVSPRPLLPSERALIAGLLRHGALPEHHFHQQLDAVRVVWECDCGCSSIEFQSEARPSINPEKARPVVDAYGVTTKGVNVGLILWGTDHELSRLEIYSLDSDPPFAVPTPDTITDDPPKPTWFEDL
jgi:hypothetical protein